jgi:hypothetical protein
MYYQFANTVSPRLATIAQISFALCILLMLTSSMDADESGSILNEPDMNRARQSKAQFYYMLPLYESSAEIDLDNISKYQPTFQELGTAVRRYREMSQGILRQLSLSHEVALRTEQLLLRDNIDTTTDLLSSHIEHKLSKVAQLLEENSFVLDELLNPFPVTIGYSKFTNVGANASSTLTPANESVEKSDHLRKISALQPIARYIPPYHPGSQRSNDFGSEELPYGDASQVIAHITRDWTSSGAPIRELTYKWIVDQLWKYHRQINNDELCEAGPSFKYSVLSPVLVPGAGMGR